MKTPSERLLTKAELSEETGLKLSFINRHLKEIPHYKLGTLVKFKMSEFNDWLKQRKVS